MEPREFHWPFSALYSWVARGIQAAYPDIAERLAIPEEAETLLDIGGGDGRLAVALAARYPRLLKIVSADISRDMARRAARRAAASGFSPRIVAEVQDAHRLTYPDGTFDAVVSFASLHHWRRPEEALREARRVLRPGGWLCIADGNGRPSFGQIHRAVARFGGSALTAAVFWLGSRDTLTADQVAGACRAAGLADVAIGFEAEGLIVRVCGFKPRPPGLPPAQEHAE